MEIKHTLRKMHRGLPLPHPGGRLQNHIKNHPHQAHTGAHLPVHTENPQVGLPIAEGKLCAGARDKRKILE
jgi:hypothetical protein